MRSVIFTGYYGMKNYGDDLFGIVSAYGARTWWPQYSPAILAPRISGENERFTVPDFISSDRFADGGVIGKMIRTIFTARELVSESLVVYGGGSLFSSNRSRIMDMAKWMSKVNGKKFAAVGVSIGPFDSQASEDAVLAFLRCFEYISVRDRASYEILKNLNLGAQIMQGRDLAGLAPALAGGVKRVEYQQPVLGYSSCAIYGQPETTQRIDDMFIAAVRRRPEVRVKVFNLNSHAEYGDSERSHYVHQRLTDAGIKSEVFDYSQAGVMNTWNAIAACTAMVSVRLHGAITAYLSGVPFIHFEYHKKCTDFLDDIGQPPELRVCMRIDDLSNLAVNQFCSQLDLLLSSPSVPTLDPAQYAAESTSHFKQAPWAALQEGS